jgi:acetate kinase
MGYTSVAGIEMVARSGDLDPSVVTHIMDIEKKTPAEMASLLTKKSGMYGISGVSDDFRFIETAAREGNERAMLAIKMYAYNVAQYVAKYCVALQGMNTLVFTGGIGEHQSIVRKLVCENLKFMGVEIDEQTNKDCFGDEAILSTADSKITVAVIPTNEELMIAKDTVKLAFNK